MFAVKIWSRAVAIFLGTEKTRDIGHLRNDVYFALHLRLDGGHRGGNSSRVALRQRVRVRAIPDIRTLCSNDTNKQ